MRYSATWAPLAAFTAFCIALVFAVNRRSLCVFLAIPWLAKNQMLAYIWPKKLGFQGKTRDWMG